MGIFLIIILIICLFWPWIAPRVSRLIQRFMARRAEDMMRRMMGMPGRKEEKRQQREQQRRQRRSDSTHKRRRHPQAQTDAATIMKDVAVDVEFTEIKEFESTTITDTDPKTGNRRIYREEQVSDVEYTEIKTSSGE